MRLLSLLLLAGCVPDGPAPDPCVAEAEVCDGLDNDCDGVADEGVGERVWRDADGDGFGDARAALLICDPPDGYVANGFDCDDGDAAAAPGAPEVCNGRDDDCDGAVDEDPSDVQTSWLDADGDGYGDPATALVACALSGRVAIGGDCDDGDATVSPGAVERCDGRDEDCDGDVDEDASDALDRWVDADLDGFGTGLPVRVCPSVPGYSFVDGDCDDGAPAVSPNGTEVPADGVDSDCDGLELCYDDIDLDGYGRATLTGSADLSCTALGVSPTSDDCDDLRPAVSPGAPEICGNQLDDDCDPATPDLQDADGDGLTCAEDCDDTAVPDAAFRYTEIAAQAGVAVLMGERPFPCGVESIAGGVAVADFDDDGDTDVFVPRIYLPDLLYENQGDGTYVDVTSAWGLGATGAHSSAVFFDADGDGDLDLYVVDVGLGDNLLYVNEGTSFVEEGVARGAAHTPPSGQCQLTYSVSAADVDGDGDLDLHVTGWQPLSSLPYDRDQLFLNDGAGFFAESDALELATRASYTSSFADFDDDGDLDVGVASDWGRSSFWRNDGGLSFVEITQAASVGTDENGMGSAVADVDGDGDLDWYVTSIYDATTPCPAGWGCTGNRLYLGNGDLTFTDGTDAAGLRNGDWSWGAAFFDRDNDGDLDLGVENGFPLAAWNGDFTRLFENDGTGSFTDVACETGLAVSGQGRGIVPFHHDADGDLDLLVVHAEGILRLFEATGAEANAWLTVMLSQGGPNPHAIGGQVWLTATAGDAEVRRDVHLNSQFGSTAPAEAHFGLADHIGPVHEIRVIWPDGTEEIFANVAPDQRVTLARGVP
ncbi:MAG: VCBS repeat-containing protein [Alphaproteobacteria bacterium]|nr:VCBS repeat-containing protein [Alphaproteobacteria bacterium]